jgi:hypothetical protein
VAAPLVRQNPSTNIFFFGYLDLIFFFVLTYVDIFNFFSGSGELSPDEDEVMFGAEIGGGASGATPQMLELFVVKVPWG